jgi:replication fork protection complex subunit Csm3/Swi3
MPATTSSPQHTGSAAPDELDRILDYDDAVNDFLQDLPLRETGQNDAPARDQNPPDEDQEVQVKKKRKPVPKLDENL